MKFALRCALLLTSIYFFSGCYSQQYIAGGADKPAMMSGGGAEKAGYTVVKHFKITDRSGWFILGLIKSGHTDMNEIINNQIKTHGGDAVINLSIKTEYDALDVIVTILVGGIYNTRVSHIEGDIIKYN